MTFTNTIESPIFHLQNNNETEALNVLRQLQKPGTITNETYALLNESKALLQEDLARGNTQNLANSWIPLFKIGFLRVLVSLSFSLPLSGVYLLVLSLRDGTLPNLFWFVFLRLVGVTCSVLFIDHLGRKVTSAISFLVGSISLLGFGAIYSNSILILGDNLNSIIFFLLVCQFTSGLVAPSSTCYLSEAFSLSVRPYFILIVIVVENVVQIIICSQSTISSAPNFAYALAALQFIMSFVVVFMIPETKNTTLREALEKFKRIFHMPM